MTRKGFLAAVLLGLCTPIVAAEDRVDAGGVRYPTAITSRLGGKPVKMVLTGTAIRTKWSLHVYAIGSYVQEGVKVRDAGGLVKGAVPKQLHLVFERALDGKTLADSFRNAVAMNHPAPAFAAELASLARHFESQSVQKGDQIWLTSIPGIGLQCQKVGSPAIVIASDAFAQAVWEVYLGPRNLGVAIKSGLTSRL